MFITITAYNRGLAPVQIVTVRLAIANPAFGTTFSPSLGLGNDDCLEGAALPLLLKDGHQEQWTFDALEAAKRQFGDLGDNLEGLVSEFIIKRKRPKRYRVANNAVGLSVLATVVPSCMLVALSGWGIVVTKAVVLAVVLFQLALLVPFSILLVLYRTGIVAALDLGNGVQVVSAPMWRLTWQFQLLTWKTNREISKREWQ